MLTNPTIQEKIEVGYYRWRNQKHSILPAALFQSGLLSNLHFAFQQSSC